MLSTRALVPALVLLSLFLAASANPTAPADTNEKSNEGEVVPSPSTRKGTALKREIDYRKSSCMPPLTQEFTYFEYYETAGCLYGSWALSAASLSEYIDCKSLKLKTPRDFSVRQLLECVNLGVLSGSILCSSFPSFMPVQDALSFIFYNGLSLNSSYLSTKKYPTPGPHFCTTASSVAAFQFKKGYTAIKQNDEVRMAKIVAMRGPIIATLFLQKKYIVETKSTVDRELIDYKSGILDHETFCLQNLSALTGTDTLFRASVIVVGYRKENGVNVWILRNDWFGANWGMDGYFYLKRGINACYIALNAFSVLG